MFAYYIVFLLIKESFDFRISYTIFKAQKFPVFCQTD